MPWLIGLTILCLGVGGLTAHVGYAVVGILVGCILVALIAVPITSLTVAATTTLLVVLPDSPTLFDIGRFEVTPRILMLCALAVQSTVAAGRGRVRLRFTLAAPWGLYGAAAIIGAVTVGRLQAVPLFLLLAVLPYCVGCTFGSDASLLRGVVKGLIAGAVILSLVAVTEFLRHKAFFAPVHDPSISAYVRGGNLRASAGWAHPLALGMFLCLAGFLAIEEGRRRSALLGVAAAVLLGAAIFSTQERSPLLGIIAGAFVYVSAQLRGRRRRGAAALAGIAIVAVFAAPGPSGAAFRQFLGASTVSGTAAATDVTARGKILSLGLHALSVRPVLGFGFGTLSNVAGNATLAPLLTSQTAFTDVADWPLAIALETGTVGLCAFTIIVAVNFTRLARSRKYDYPLPAVAILAGLVAALVTSLGVAQDASSLIFLFALGLASTGLRSQGRLVRAPAHDTGAPLRQVEKSVAHWHLPGASQSPLPR